jgi:peptidyl-tRNA hydrolase
MNWTMQHTANTEDILVMYLIVNMSLNMSCGKIAAQCGHAVQLLLEKYYRILDTDIPTKEDQGKVARIELWKLPTLNGGYRKVVLQAREKDWSYLKQNYDPIVVVDAGITEIASGRETVLGLFPIFKEERCNKLKRLQCLG